MNLTVVKTVWYLTSQNPAESSKVDLNYGTLPFRLHTCYSIQRQDTTALRVGLTEDMQSCGAARGGAMQCRAVRCCAVRCGATSRPACAARAAAAPSACCSASLRQESAATGLCGAVQCGAVQCGAVRRVHDGAHEQHGVRHMGVCCALLHADARERSAMQCGACWCT